MGRLWLQRAKEHLLLTSIVNTSVETDTVDELKGTQGKTTHSAMSSFQSPQHLPSGVLKPIAKNFSSTKLNGSYICH